MTFVTPVTPAYAAVAGLLFFGLSVRTLRFRRRHRVAIGDGDVPELRRAARAHANFAEYTPLTLLLLYFVELQYGTGWLVHAGCLSLLAGRCLHAFGVSRVDEDFRFRVAGMALTFTAMVGGALAILLARV